MYGSGSIDGLSTLSVNTTPAAGGGASSTTIGIARAATRPATIEPVVEDGPGSLAWILDKLAAAIHELEQVLEVDDTSDAPPAA